MNDYYGKDKYLARMKVVMVLAPGARDLKQTDKMAKPIRWMPPPTMYLKIFNLKIFQTWIDIWKYLVPKTSRDPVLQHHGRAPWEIFVFLCVLFWSGAHQGWFGCWWTRTYSRLRSELKRCLLRRQKLSPGSSVDRRRCPTSGEEPSFKDITCRRGNTIHDMIDRRKL